MNFKKRVNGSWTDTPHYIHKTSTDTITTLPDVVYVNDTTATVGLKGDMSQSSTPTPTTPIQPSECGDLETEGTKAGQYKIPILSANTTTPVYLGEVETTRKIKKVVFKGDETENWGYSSSGNNARVFLSVNSMAASPSISTHYQFGVIRTYPNLNEYCINNASALVIGVDINSITSAADFKTYLAQQYANGTPVTIWYVLATETTGIVNEPIRKIGDYADSISGITIPTIAGANTLSIGTTLQPSEVTANYHGWHPVQSVHEAGRTVNIYDKYNTIDIPDFGVRYGVYCELGNYSIYNNTDNNVYWFSNNGSARFQACSPHSTSTVSMVGANPAGFYMPYNDGSLGEVTIVEGSTVPDHYIPYIDWD